MRILRGTLALLVVLTTVRPCAAESGCPSAASHRGTAVQLGASAQRTPAHDACCGSGSHAATTTAAHAACPATGATAAKAPVGAQKCSAPFGSACDLGASSSATAARGISNDAPPAISHSTVVAPAATHKAQHLPPAGGGDPRAFGPLYLAHQALML